MKVKIWLLVLIVLAFVLPTIFFWWAQIFPASVHQNVYRLLEQIFPQSPYISLQKANTLYEDEEFQQALRMYKLLEPSLPEKKNILSHNMGNTYYRLGELERQTNKLNTYTLRNLAITAYQYALYKQTSQELQSPNSKKTQENIAFVREKLETLKKELLEEGIEDLPPPPPPTTEENGQEDHNNSPPPNMPQHQPQSPNSPPPRPQEPGSNPQNWGEDGPTGENPPPNASDEMREYPKAESGKIDESDLLDNAGLSKEERQKIERHIRNLQEEEEVNMELNKPSPKTDIYDILNDPFFDTLDPNASGW